MSIPQKKRPDQRGNADQAVSSANPTKGKPMNSEENSIFQHPSARSNAALANFTRRAVLSALPVFGVPASALAVEQTSDVSAVIQKAAINYLAALRDYKALIRKESEATAALEAFEWEPWVATTGAPTDRWFLAGCKLQSAHEARKVFAERRCHIRAQFASDQSDDDADWNEHWREQTDKYLALADAYEQEALTYLSACEARYRAAEEELDFDGITAATDAAQEACAAARDELFDIPCWSLADVQAKADAILSSGNDGSFTMGDMGPEEVARLLASFGGRASS